MNSLIIEVKEDKYLIRYKVLKSVVSRKHTLRKVPSSLTNENSSKEGKVIQQLEKHPVACELYLYKINCLDETYLDVLTNLSKKNITKNTEQGLLTYLGRGLSKCSDKDKFDKVVGIRMAICNIEGLKEIVKYDINSKIHKL